ncbi:MAG: FAD-dependent oxidoreductase [Chloroflexi bacterium]|nr:FAD-dependent oxidoreductase [Chloroflexota bacterium]
MSTQSVENRTVAVIGAGPAGIFAARELNNAGVEVALINRDIKPGGLAEYGIFHNKYKMKNGLRNQFRKSLADPQLHYYGNVAIGVDKELSLSDLQAIGFDAILVTVGAQGTKWLGLPGEDLMGVYHAKDLVYHYNHLPPFSEREYPIGDNVVCIGVGNVMLDIANWTIRDLKVKQVTAVARRGPAAVKFTKKEMSIVINNLDMEHLDAEFARTSALMQSVDQDPVAAKEFILSALKRSEEPVSDTRFRLVFLASPTGMVGDAHGNVIGLEVDETTLELHAGRTKAISTGKTHIIDADTVVFCIGDRVDDSFGLPLDKWNDYAKHPNPQFPHDGNSYEAYNPRTDEWVEGVFLAGWAREASTGLVGAARKDGIIAARVMLEYLESLEKTASSQGTIKTLKKHFAEMESPVVDKQNIIRLEEIEQQKTEELSIPEFKFSANADMLAAVGLLVGEAQ